MDRVTIKWIDAECQEDRWSDIDEAREACLSDLVPCYTSGYLLHEHAQHITVTLTIGGDACGPHITIPRSCIVEIEIHEPTRCSKSSKARQKYTA
jgi:hypothetical protein